MLKTLFLGNSAFSYPTLETLKLKTSLQAVVTGQDQWVTQRKKILTEPLPKIYAREQNIPYLQPKNLKDPNFLETIQNYHADLFIIISYGKILPPEVFDIPSLGTFNLHASLLPRYRGASPIQEALLNGDSETGISLQKINQYVDDGSIYVTTQRSVSPSMKYPELYQLLSLDAAKTLEEFLDILEQTGKLPEAKKQTGEVSFCKKITKNNGIISFCEQNAQEIFNKFRAYYTWPQISFSLKDIQIKLEEMDMHSPSSLLATPGTVLQADRKAFIVQTKQGTLSLSRLKVSGKKSLDFSSFINGYQIKQGDILC